MTRDEAARDWLLTATPARRWVAIRREPLDPYHVLYGCRRTVKADSLAELELQLTLEAMMRGFVDAARIDHVEEGTL